MGLRTQSKTQALRLLLKSLRRSLLLKSLRREKCAIISVIRLCLKVRYGIPCWDTIKVRIHSLLVSDNNLLLHATIIFAQFPFNEGHVDSRAAGLPEHAWVCIQVLLIV